MTSDLTEVIARALRDALFPDFVGEPFGGRWCDYADAVLSALQEHGEYEPFQPHWPADGPFVCRYHGGVDWCERDKPDRVPVYIVREDNDG